MPDKTPENNPGTSADVVQNSPSEAAIAAAAAQNTPPAAPAPAAPVPPAPPAKLTWGQQVDKDFWG